MKEKNERLTEWISSGDTGFAMPCRNLINGEQRCINKLALYEDLESEDRLITLPCKPDELVWIVDDSGARPGFYTSRSDILADIENGKSIAYTKELAEKKYNLSVN